MEKQPILVVDDEKYIRMTISQSLEPLDLPIWTAASGEEALQKLQESPFGLVFLDMKMPRMGGMEILRRIKEEWPKIRVIIITAHATIESAVEAMKLGAVDFIQKPFSPDDIRELAISVLKHETPAEEQTVDYDSLIELTKSHILDRRFGAARETVRKAIALDPAQPEAYNLFGALLEINGKMFEAQKFYLAAMDINPKYKPAEINLKRTISWNKSDNIDIG